MTQPIITSRFDDSTPLMRITVNTSPHGRFAEVCFQDPSDEDVHVCSGYLNASERAALADRLREVAQELEAVKAAEPEIQRDWWVTGTALCPAVIELECRATGVRGYVQDFSRVEWGRAFSAPSNSYQWTDSSRVIVLPAGKSPVDVEGALTELTEQLERETRGGQEAA